MRPRSVPWLVPFLAALTVVAVTSASTTGAAATLAVLALPAGARELGRVVLWMAAGAGICGALGWVAATVLVPGVAATLAVGSGLAIGGGLGAVVRLLAVGETETQEPETVTVERQQEEGTPDPRPADLFETSPDPILYYDDGGDGPVVRAVNPAYEEAFGASMAAVSDAGLADALMVTEAGEEIVTAASEAATLDRTVTCETSEGRAEFRVRLAAVETDGGVRGYVLYTRQ